MSQVYLSYRRENSPVTALRLYERLVHYLGKKNVVLGSASLPPDANAVDYIRRNMLRCDLVLVLIRPHWLDAVNSSGQALWDDPQDPARLELETAFMYSMQVIPVVADGGRIPRPSDLPPGAVNLASLNQWFVDTSDDQVFDTSVRGLVTLIKLASEQRVSRRQSTRGFRWPWQRDRPQISTDGRFMARSGAPDSPVRVFISYSGRDRATTMDLANRLSTRGYGVWFDQHLTGGHDWWDTILSSIRQCNVFLMLLTANSLNSHACRLECSYAQALDKRILPVLASDGVEISMLPESLQRIQLVDYRGSESVRWPRLEQAFRALPPESSLPAPLPRPPLAPISPLAKTATRINRPMASLEEQASLVSELKEQLRDPETAAEAQKLLGMLRREALSASIAREIDELLA